MGLGWKLHLEVPSRGPIEPISRCGAAASDTAWGLRPIGSARGGSALEGKGGVSHSYRFTRLIAHSKKANTMDANTNAERAASYTDSQAE
jgi:hypothetical protein